MSGTRSFVVAAVTIAGMLAGCTQVAGGVGSGPRALPGPHYPYIEFANDQYTLEIHSFCANAGVPIRVTVRDGTAVDGVYLEAGDTNDAGEQSDVSPG
jgi:hypothetical protein